MNFTQILQKVTALANRIRRLESDPGGIQYASGGGTENFVQLSDAEGKLLDSIIQKISATEIGVGGKVTITVANSNTQFKFGRSGTSPGSGYLYANDTYIALQNTGQSDIAQWAQSGRFSALYGLTVAGTTVIATQTPASATAAGTAGQIAWDANYIYVCVAANTWKRVAIASW